MALTEEAVISNNFNSKQISLRAVHNWKFQMAQPVIAIPFIQTAPANTILFRFMGLTEKASFSFLISDDGVDVSNGDSIVTIDQQINYLRTQIFTHEFDTSWTFSNTSGPTYFTSIICTITNLSIDSRAGAPVFAIGHMTIQRGRIGLL